MICGALCYFVSLITYVVSSDIQWNYDAYGPDKWPESFQACSGLLQSPINLVTSQARYDPNLGDIRFYNYDTVEIWNLTNNGHTIYSTSLNQSDLDPYINGISCEINETFYLTQLHWHWGPNISYGSEHHIDSKIYPAELHLVHQNPNKTQTTVVLAFLYELSLFDNPKLDEVLKAIEYDVYMDSSDLSKFQLDDFLPDPILLKREGYYKYTGSLTTPPCTENVVWIVFESKIKISVKQLQSFHKNVIKLNDRPVQSIGNRTLYKNKPGPLASSPTVFSRIKDYFKSVAFTIQNWIYGV